MSFGTIISRLNRRDTPLFPRLTLKTKITFFSLFILSSAFWAPRLLAQTAPQPENVIQYKQNAISTGGNQESWMDEALKGNMVSVLNVLTGTIPNTCFQQQFKCYNPGSGQQLGGAIGTNTGMIASLFAPPASGVEYLAQIKDSFLGKPALAQGVGFKGLQPILPLWRSFRNAVYLISSLLFIAIGVMIILKVKISPQATVNIQNSIPGLITALVLVTFSYAIAGLIIDLSSVFQALVVALLFQGQGKALGDNIVGSGNHVFNYTTLANPSLSAVFNLTWYMLPMNAIALIGTVLGAIVGGILGAPASLAVGPFGPLVGAGIGAGVGTVLVLLIVAILVLFWQLKFFFGLIKTYVTIIFKIIIAPFEIAAGAIPGMKMGFSSWITDLIAYISVFPISIIFLVIANIIIEKTGVSVWQNNPVAGGGIWTPSLLNGGGLPGAWAALSGGLVPAGIGLVAAGIMSKLPDMVPQFIFGIKPSPWTQAAEQSYKQVGGLAAQGAWSGGNEALKYAQTGPGQTRIANLIHKLPGKPVVTPSTVGKVAGGVQDLYQNVAATQGKKFK
ncbi:MAG: hypothetical protein WCT01_03545 [Candidatus Shapirobacteria bacterium]